MVSKHNIYLIFLTIKILIYKRQCDKKLIVLFKQLFCTTFYVFEKFN